MRQQRRLTAPVAAADGDPHAHIYPLRLDGRLDDDLSRWLWLVKWLLAIPHFIVLWFLWIAFAVLTLHRVLRDPLHRALSARAVRLQRRRAALDVAGRLLLLQRARHGSLSAVHARRRAGLPGAASIDYPERLSRGLVLVKWWLLAIPHYLIVSLFGSGSGGAPAGGAASTTSHSGSVRAAPAVG